MMDGVVLGLDSVLDELGVSNRRPELFDALVRLIDERGAGDATVTDLCDRYLPPDAPRDGEELTAWAAERKDRLFFSDTYGYRWFVAPADLPPRASRR